MAQRLQQTALTVSNVAANQVLKLVIDLDRMKYHARCGVGLDPDCATGRSEHD